MTKRPNKVGRIEADPKPKRKIPWAVILTLVAGITLVSAGVWGTLQYQAFINDVKASGVATYKKENCEEFSQVNKNKVQVKWLECDE